VSIKKKYTPKLKTLNKSIAQTTATTDMLPVQHGQNAHWNATYAT